MAGKAEPGLLGPSEPERIAFARSLIESPDAAFQKMVTDVWTARHPRLRIVLPLLRR